MFKKKQSQNKISTNGRTMVESKSMRKIIKSNS